MTDREQWDLLCKEYVAADDRFKAAWRVVTSKYSAIGAGTSTENPTDDELHGAQQARAERDSIDARMRAFMKEKFGTDI